VVFSCCTPGEHTVRLFDICGQSGIHTGLLRFAFAVGQEPTHFSHAAASQGTAAISTRRARDRQKVVML
jgi:hypothetical protein